MALLAQDPGNSVHNIGFAAAVGSNNASQAAAAERDLRLFAERFEAYQLDFSQFEQDFPFYGLRRRALGRSKTQMSRQRRVPIPGKGRNCVKIALLSAFLTFLTLGIVLQHASHEVQW